MIISNVSTYFKFVTATILFSGLIVLAAMQDARADQFVVLYGAHNSKASASSQVASLFSKRIAAVPMPSHAKNVSHVVVSDYPFGDRKSAEWLAKKTGGSVIAISEQVAARITAKAQGVAKPAASARASENKKVHTVFLGAFKSRAAANAERNKIAVMYGIKPVVVTTRHPGYTHVILSGVYSSRKAASAAARVFLTVAGGAKDSSLKVTPVSVSKTLLGLLSSAQSYIAVERSIQPDLIPVALNRRESVELSKDDAISAVDGLIHVVLNRDQPRQVMVRRDDGFFSLQRRIEPQHREVFISTMCRTDGSAPRGAPDWCSQFR